MQTDDADVIVFAYGGTARSAKKAVRDASPGHQSRANKTHAHMAFDDEPLLRAKARKPKAVIVPEMNLGQLILPVKRVMGDACPVIGVNKIGGQYIEPEEILEAIKEAH